MEFYARQNAQLQWNMNVSIPNRMEFYAASKGVNFASAKKSFNSQRDGILRYSPIFRKKIEKIVSIPNGMEFYLE